MEQLWFQECIGGENMEKVNEGTKDEIVEHACNENERQQFINPLVICMGFMTFYGLGVVLIYEYSFFSIVVIWFLACYKFTIIILFSSSQAFPSSLEFWVGVDLGITTSTKCIFSITLFLIFFLRNNVHIFRILGILFSFCVQWLGGDYWELVKAQSYVALQDKSIVSYGLGLIKTVKDKRSWCPSGTTQRWHGKESLSKNGLTQLVLTKLTSNKTSKIILAKKMACSGKFSLQPFLDLMKQGGAYQIFD